MLTSLWLELSNYSLPELTAVIASLTYVVLAARGHRYCWPAAFVGSAIYVAVFWQYRLLMDSALNAYYVAMAVYGWQVWTAGAPPSTRDSRETHTGTGNTAIDTNKSAATTHTETPVRRWHWHRHALSLVTIAALSITSGYYLAQYSDAAFPYLDSLTTWSSLLATWMVARRVLENWLYWIAIDGLSIYLYLHKGLYFTTALFFLYAVIAVFGFLHWLSLYRQQTPPMYNAVSIAR